MPDPTLAQLREAEQDARGVLEARLWFAAHNGESDSDPDVDAYRDAVVARVRKEEKERRASELEVTAHVVGLRVEHVFPRGHTP